MADLMAPLKPCYLIRFVFWIQSMFLFTQTNNFRENLIFESFLSLPHLLIWNKTNSKMGTAGVRQLCAKAHYWASFLTYASNKLLTSKES